MRDMTGTICHKCDEGRYRETSMHDDIDGVLHCTNCGDEVKRWKSAEELGLPHMLSCPFCGFQPNVCDDDALYPVGRDRKVWGAHCYETGGGCGASVLGYSPQDAVNTWNKRASQDIVPVVQSLLVAHEQVLDANTSNDRNEAQARVINIIEQLKYLKFYR